MHPKFLELQFGKLPVLFSYTVGLCPLSNTPTYVKHS